MSQELREGLLNPCPGSPIPHHSQPETHIHLFRPGKDPPVARKGTPGGRLPEDDARTVRQVTDVRPQGESPQDPPRVDQGGVSGHSARGAIGTDHEVSVQIEAGAEPVPVDPSLFLQRFDRSRLYRDRPRFDGRVMEQGIEYCARDGNSMPRVGEAFAARQSDGAPGRPHDRDLPDGSPDRCGYPQLGQHLESPGADDVAARLVTRKGRLVDQGDPGTATGQHQRRHAAGRTSAHDDDVKAR